MEGLRPCPPTSNWKLFGLRPQFGSAFIGRIVIDSTFTAGFRASTMADDADVEVESQASDSKSRDMQQQSKALDSITDYAEERQLDGKKVQEVSAVF